MAGTLYLLGTVFGVWGGIAGGKVLGPLISSKPVIGMDMLGLDASESAKMMVIAGLGYLSDFLICTLFPNSHLQIAGFAFLAELPFPIWLVIKGLLNGRGKPMGKELSDGGEIMKKYSVAILVAILVSLAIISTASAQGEEITLGLSRDFGTSGFNGDIQGTFTLKASGPANLVRVQFFLDDNLLGEDPESPFAIQFITDNYTTGAHFFRAVGFTTDGKQIGSKTISAVFVSKEEGLAASLKIVLPILVVAFGAMAISAITSLINVRKGKKLPAGAARSYSFGGGICPNCKRPFGFQLLGIHMFGSKLTPCPHCGKWSVVKGATMSELHAAELAEVDTEKVLIPEALDEE